MRKIVWIIALMLLISSCQRLTIEFGPSKDPQPKPPPDDFPAGPIQHKTLAQVILEEYHVVLEQAQPTKLPSVTETAFYKGDKWRTYKDCLAEAFDEIGSPKVNNTEWRCKASLEDFDAKRWWSGSKDPNDPLYYYDHTQGVLFADTPEGHKWALSLAHNSATYQAQGIGANVELPGLNTPITITRGYDFEPRKIIAAVYDAREYHHGRVFVFFIQRFRAPSGEIFVGVTTWDWCLDPMAEICPDPTPWLTPKQK